jgi:hypothetical protein
LPWPPEALLLAATLIGLPDPLSDLGDAFSCFRFLISRLLRLCPLAMAERPFGDGCALAGLRGTDWFEAVLRGDSLMPLLFVADAVLRRISPRRERASNAVNFRGLRERAEVAAQADSLSDGEDASVSRGGRYARRATECS